MNAKEQIRQIYAEYNRFIIDLEMKIAELELERDRQILEIERACDHQSDGIVLMESCKKCGTLLD